MTKVVFLLGACPPKGELCIYSCRFLCTVLAENHALLIAKSCVVLFTVHKLKGFEPVVRLLMLIRALNKENIMVKEAEEEIEY